MSVDNSGMTIEGTNSFGDLLAAELSEKQQEQLANNGYQIYSVEMDGATATVEFHAPRNCTLVVGIYDEDKVTLLGTGTAEVTPEQDKAEVDIAVPDMPQYFYIKGYLANTHTLTPLCAVYSNPEYTQAMREFYAKTAEDFDSERVLNLDDDPTNNFAVYSEETILIPENEGYNQITENTDGTYTIENADENFLALKAGDTFSYSYGEGDMLIARIGEIAIDGTTVTITPVQIGMDDVFEHVRIDVDGDMDDAEITPAEGVEVVQGDEGSEVSTIISAESKDEKKLRKDFDKTIVDETTPGGGASANLRISGYLEFTSSFDAEVNIGAGIEDRIELRVDYELGASFTVDAKTDFEFALGNVKFKPIAGLTLSIAPSVSFRMDAKFIIEGSFTGCFGIRALPTGKKLENISRVPKPDLKSEITGKVYIGINLNPKVSLIHDKFLSAELDVSLGFELTVQQTFIDTTNTSTIHECLDCMSGELYFVPVIKGKLSVLSWFFDEMSIDIVDTRLPICEFYYSVDHNEFGLAKQCPYRLQLITLIFQNEEGSPIDNLSVNISSQG